MAATEAISGTMPPATAATTTATVAAPARPTAPNAAMSRDQLHNAAREFEAFFLARALEPMFEGIQAEAPFGGGMAEDLWRSLLVDEYGKAMAKAGGIGLADAMVRSLIELQETLPPPLPAGEPATALEPSAPPTSTETMRP